MGVIGVVLYLSDADSNLYQIGSGRFNVRDDLIDCRNRITDLNRIGVAATHLYVREAVDLKWALLLPV